MQTAYLADSYLFDWKSLSFRSDLVLVLPVAICLVVGIFSHHPGAGVISGSGALIAGFGLKQTIDDSRLLPMILVTLGMAGATFVGMVAGHNDFILAPIVALAAFAYGMLSQEHPGLSWVGQTCVIFVLVASAFPFSPRAAAVRASLILAGGSLQILSCSIFLRLLPQLRRDLLSVPGYLQEQRAALLSTMADRENPFHENPIVRAVWPYSLRLAITLAVSTEIYRRMHFINGYWIPMTALLVLKPGLIDTANRAIARTLGTLAGAVLASVFIAHLTPAPGILVAGTLLFAWLSYATNNVNYALFSLFITSYIVFLFSLLRLPGDLVAYQRAVCTVIGGSLALAVRLVVIRYRLSRQNRLSPGSGQ